MYVCVWGRGQRVGDIFQVGVRKKPERFGTCQKTGEKQEAAFKNGLIRLGWWI